MSGKNPACTSAMHIGRHCRFADFLAWTRGEAGYLIVRSLLVTASLQFALSFLTILAPLLTIIGTALAIILAFRNQQCYARLNETLARTGIHFVRKRYSVRCTKAIAKLLLDLGYNTGAQAIVGQLLGRAGDGGTWKSAVQQLALRPNWRDCR